jgi:hypothetical protein
MRALVLLLGLAITVLLGYATAHDIATHGVTLPSALGAGVVFVLGIGLLGALLNPPPPPPPQ